MVKYLTPKFLTCLVIILAAVLLISGCSSEPDEPIPTEKKTFWAQDFATNSYYEVPSELLAVGQYCTVWAETAAKISIDAARSMADTYDKLIYPKMMDTFGIYGNISEVKDGPIIAHNTMELADWVGDGDGKLSILLLDIKDTYSPPNDESYVGGYFWVGNLLEIPYSNKMDMIYVDCYPGVPGSAGSNKTLAHEMQHLMNVVTSALLRNNSMDLWIDEGLSTAAEYLSLDAHPEDRYQYFNMDISGLISQGNNFFVWGNHSDESPYAVLDDYSTAYLFFQWLRLQAGGNRILYEIISSSNYDYRAVTTAADKYMSGNGYSKWETLLNTWLAANYLNNPSGKYGYLNDPTLKSIKAQTAPAGKTRLPLAPGEGVYSIINFDFDTPLPSAQGNIRYSSLNKNTVSNTEASGGGALLTYNVNINKEGTSETGILTGVAAAVHLSPEISRQAALRSFGPIHIGPQDMLARNGYEKEIFSAKFPLKPVLSE